MRMKNRKAISFFLLVLFSGIGIFFLAPTVHASFADTMGNIVGGLIGIIISALGVILALVIKVLVIVAQYSDFIDSAAVSNGWKIVRDLCNMFFVLVLLIIAFATILKIENYSYKKYLPKLILMAILINFSKTICGLLIDFAQVIMLTFVNAFKDVAGGNLISNLGITDVMTLAKNSKDVGFWAIISAYVLGLIYVLIALVVIVTMLAMLVMRIVMIWIYVVLSPAAYLFSAFPGGQKYASQWWDEFTKNLIVGPVLAFFIWLSFISLQGVDQVPGFASDTSTAAGLAGDMNIDTSSATDKNPDGTPFAASKASTPGVLIKFVIGIGMLIGGLKVSQQIGGAAGSIAGKGMTAIQKGTVFAGKGALGAAGWVGRQADTAQMWAQKKTAGKFGHENYKPKSLNISSIKEGFKQSREEKMQKYKNLYGGAANNWHDSFNKYSDLRQYGSIRKSEKHQAKDNESAEELESENAILQRRKSYVGLGGKEYSDKRNDLIDTKDQIIDSYITSAPKRLKTDTEKKQWAEEQYDEDLKHVESVDAEKPIADLEEQVASNQQKVEKLRDVRWQVAGKGVGLNKSYRYEPVYGSSGDKENQKKEEQAMSSRTGEDNFALVSELIKASNENDSTKIACAFKLLAKNNDLNEALKDNRIANLMTKNNGILEHLAKKGTFGSNANNDQSIKAIKEDYSSNRVTPAYLQALAQGMFDKAGANPDLAARYANDIGHTAFANGNGIAYAMADGNASSGKYEFSELDYKNGKLNTSDARKAATTGKFNTMESQTKMRMLHPDTLISEDVDGRATGITDDGLSVLRNTNSHDLGQINRMRPDVIKKIGNSKKAMKDLINLVFALEAEGNADQAKNIKYFANYIQQKKEGKGLKDAGNFEQEFETLKEMYV